MPFYTHLMMKGRSFLDQERCTCYASCWPLLFLFSVQNVLKLRLNKTIKLHFSHTNTNDVL